MASKPYACLHFQSIKHLSNLSGAYNHNYRQGDKPENVAGEKSHLNQELIALQNGETYADAYRRRIKEGGVKTVRKNNTKAIEVMLTYNQKNVPPDFSLDAWSQANVEWLQETFGKENVVSAVLHLDETTPHIHAVIVPVKDGKLAATELLQSTPELQEKNGKRGFEYLQDKYAEKMQPFGLKRGIRKSKASHEHIQNFYNALTENISQTLPEPEKNETIGQYAERVAKEQYSIQMSSFKKQKELERQIIELSSANGSADTIAQLTQEVEDLTGQLEEARKVSERTILDATRMRYIIKALKNDYPSAESREGDFEYLQELVQAGELFEKGYTREEVDKILSGEMVEEDRNEEVK